MLNDVASARVEADVESLRLAEIYSKDELLANMPIPRMRVKDLSITLPIAIDKVDERQLEEAKKPFAADTVRKKAEESLTNILSKRRIRLSGRDLNTVRSSLKGKTESIAKNKSWVMNQVKPLSNEIVSAIDAQIEKAGSNLDPVELKKIKEEFQADLRTSLINLRPSPPNLDVIVNTSSLQNISEKDKLVYINFNVDEVGLEWSVYETSTGETRERLVPE